MITGYMPQAMWRETVEFVQGIRLHVYMAQILGEDAVFRFRRRFLPMQMTTWPYSVLCEWDMDDNGVFEFCVKRIDIETNAVVSRERRWFMLFEGDYYDLEYDEILFALFNLNAQVGVQ